MCARAQGFPWPVRPCLWPTATSGHKGLACLARHACAHMRLDIIINIQLHARLLQRFIMRWQIHLHDFFSGLECLIHGSAELKQFKPCGRSYLIVIVPDSRPFLI